MGLPGEALVRSGTGTWPRTGVEAQAAVELTEDPFPKPASGKHGAPCSSILTATVLEEKRPSVPGDLASAGLDFLSGLPEQVGGLWPPDGVCRHQG